MTSPRCFRPGRPMGRVLLLAGLLASCGTHEGSAPQRVVKVNVMTVSATETGTLREYVGTLEESAASSLSFGVGGRVTAVYVKEGQHVAAGQLLASVDNGNATNAFNAAQATLGRAKDGYRRAKQVYDQGSLPEVKLIEVQTQLDQAQSMFDIAKKGLDDCNLYAPTAGTIADRLIERGSSVTAFQPVMRLLDLSGLYVRMSLPEVDASRVRVGDRVQVAVGALEETDSLMLPGVVEERGVSADPISHSYLVRIRLLSHRQGLLPGMVCRVRLAGGQAVSGIEVPARAVRLASDGRRYVWVAKDSTAQQCQVLIGDLTQRGVLVAEGLAAGDQVIVDGTDKLSVGTKIVY